MKTILIFPILFLIFGAPEYQTAVIEDCDEDGITSNPLSKVTISQGMQQTQRKSDSLPTKQQLQVENKKPSSDLNQKQGKKLNGISIQIPKRKRVLPPKRPVNRRQQIPIVWPPKPKPVNLVIKPIVQPKSMEFQSKRKLSDYFPTYQFPKQKRLKLIPAYEEFETYADPDYESEIVYQGARKYDYIEVSSSPNYGAPCEGDSSSYKDSSAEVQDASQISAREMDDSSTEVPEIEMFTTESHSRESETEKELEVTTLDPNIEPRDGSIPINNTDENNSNVIEMIIRGLLTLVSCLKSKTPVIDDVVSNLLHSAANSCNKSNHNNI